MSQLQMGVGTPPGLDIGHIGLGAARELILEEHFVQLILVDQEEHSVQHHVHSVAAASPLLWGVDHHVPGTHEGDTEVARHLDTAREDLHGPGARAGDTDHQDAVREGRHDPGGRAGGTHHLDAVREELHGPGTLVVDTHHPGAVREELHGPDTLVVDTHHPGAVMEELHGPGIGHHHGHPVEAPNHVLPHAVGFFQIAVQKVPLQRPLQSCQCRHLSSSSP
jgi:hypothetical protein